MRGITFALLIAFVGCQSNDVEPEFSNKKAYIYHYEGLILNGLPDRDIKKSGFKLTCQVRISRITDDEHILKVLSPRLEEFFGIWPKDRFIEAPKLTQEIGLCFTQWYKFDYQSGHIRNIYAPKDVPVLCVNIVKGILNLLPLTIKKSQSSYEMEEQRIDGSCNTKYIIQEDRENNHTTILQTRDLDNCTNKVVKNIGMAYVRPCPTCPVQTGNTRSTMTVTQKLKYKETGAYIIYAESQQLYELSPFNEPDGTVVMEARQNLTLIEIKDNEEIAIVQLKYYGNLNYQFSEDLPQMALHLIKPKSIETRFAEVLQQLMQLNQTQIHVKTPPNFLELIELSRMATLENLESLWKQFGNRKELRCWFLSAVVAAGNTNTFIFLKQRIQNEELSVMGSAITLVLAFQLTKPDNLTLTAAADLLADNRVQKTPLLHKLSYVGYGSMTNKYCSASSSCPAQILQPLHDLAISAAANQSREEDIILALKAIGNAGEPASIKCIKRFLPAQSPATNIFSFKVHLNAILTLRTISRKEPAKVQEIVFQIFLDRSLQPHLRMQACLVLFETKPPLSLVMAMAHFLQSESSVQVASFVYSHMEVLSAGGIPQLYNLATACRIALKLLGPQFQPKSFRYSTVLEINGYHPYFRAGAIGRAYLLHDDKLPSAIFTKIRGYYASSAMDIVEFAALFSSLSDIIEERKEEKLFSQFSFRKLQQLGRLLKEWKGLNIDNTTLRAYIKLCSQVILFGSLDEEFKELVKPLTNPEEMEKWLKEMVALFQKGFSGNMIHPLWAGEIRHIVPTAVGFPLEFGLYSTSIMHAAAEVKGQISPPPMDNFRPEQLLESNMQLSTDINASLYMDIVATMGINTPYFQNGLEFHANLNASMSVKFDAELNWKQEIFKFESTPSQEETQLLAVRTELFAISRNIDDPDTSKMSPVLPEVPAPDIPSEQWKPSQSERNFQDYGIMYSRDYDMASNASDPEEEHHYQERNPKCLAEFLCSKLLGYQICLTKKSCDAIFRKTYLHALVENRDLRLTVKYEAAGTKIQLIIQGGVNSKATLLGLSEKDLNVNVTTNQTNTKDHQPIGEHEQCSQMTERNPNGLVVILRTNHSGEILTKFQLVLHTDLHSLKPTIQVVISESSRMKICADLAILDSQTAEGILKWGQECRDYKIAAQVAYGQYDHHPAMQIKFEWGKVPSEGQAAARWLLKFLPGIVYEHRLVQKEQKNPPQEVTVVAALTSPQTCDLILRLPNITVYDTDMMLPFTIPVGQYTETSAMPPHAWNFISKVPLSVLENMKARCSVSIDSVTTFNGVRFNYTIPPNVYHILTQDCSPELKFLVMAKRTEEPDVQRSIHLTVANHEIDMYTSNGLVKVMVNGTEIPEEDLPYSSRSDDILISREKNGLLLQAPKAGIDALYYDGHVVETKVGFKMTGKTCGICGRNDVEYKQEYKMPSGSVARDAMSFVQSWTLHEDTYNRAKEQISLD